MVNAKNLRIPTFCPLPASSLLSSSACLNCGSFLQQIPRFCTADRAGQMGTSSPHFTASSTRSARSATPSPTSLSPALMQSWSAFPSAAGLTGHPSTPLPLQASTCWTSMQQRMRVIQAPRSTGASRGRGCERVTRRQKCERCQGSPPSTGGQHLLEKYAATHAGYTGPTQHGGVKGKGCVSESAGGRSVRDVRGLLSALWAGICCGPCGMMASRGTGARSGQCECECLLS